MLPPSDSEESDTEKYDDVLLAADGTSALPQSGTSSARFLSPGMSDIVNIFEQNFGFEPSSGERNLVHNIMTQPDYDVTSSTP